MQRSSASIASLAAALAKAQAELTNPEKSLVATIRSNGPRGAEMRFRYAPLSSGLEIMRKTLSRHEIAMVQTTSIDDAAGFVRLSTVLAHASGEWIASDWPICPISDTAAPHRMGAALTYARRYALFSLVGIAGEDDIDAPDLMPPTAPTSKVDKAANKIEHLTDGQGLPTRQDSKRSTKANSSSFPRSVLEPEVSAALRDRLLGELKEITSSEQAAHWAHQVLPAKNTLVMPDAERVEKAFEAKLAGLTDALDGELPRSRSLREARGKKRGRAVGVQKSVLSLPAPRRIRDRDHVRLVAKQPCLVCGRRPADGHHLRFAQPRALGRKVSDEFTVPLCRGHHREIHRCGDEAAWWKNVGIDPMAAARALWLESHPLPPVDTNGDGRSPAPLRSNRRRHPKFKTNPVVEVGSQ